MVLVLAAVVQSSPIAALVYAGLNLVLKSLTKAPHLFSPLKSLPLLLPGASNAPKVASTWQGPPPQEDWEAGEFSVLDCSTPVHVLKGCGYGILPCWKLKHTYNSPHLACPSHLWSTTLVVLQDVLASLLLLILHVSVEAGTCYFVYLVCPSVWSPGLCRHIISKGVLLHFPTTSLFGTFTLLGSREWTLSGLHFGVNVSCFIFF